MISSINSSSSSVSMKSVETKKTLGTPQETTEVAAKNTEAKTADIKGFSPSTAKATDKFKNSSTKVGGDIAIAETLSSKEKVTILKELFSTIDNRFHGDIWHGQNDGKINHDNIDKARNALHKNQKETFGLKDEGGERLSPTIIKSMLTYLEEAIKNFGDDDSYLSLPQLEKALRKVPPGKDYYISQ